MTNKPNVSVLTVLSQWFPTAQGMPDELANLTAFLEGSYPELDPEAINIVALALLAILHVVRLKPLPQRSLKTND